MVADSGMLYALVEKTHRSAEQFNENVPDYSYRYNSCLQTIISSFLRRVQTSETSSSNGVLLVSKRTLE